MFKQTLLIVGLSASASFSAVQASDPGVRDTIRVSVDTLVVGQSRPFSIMLYNDEIVRHIGMAFEFIPVDSGFAVYDSAVFVGRLADPSVLDGRVLHPLHIDGSPTDTLGVAAFKITGNMLPVGWGDEVIVYMTGVSAGLLAITNGEYSPLARNYFIDINGTNYFPIFVSDTAIVIESAPLPELQLPNSPSRFIDGPNTVFFEVSGSSPSGYPVTIQLESFENYDSTTRLPENPPWSGSGNPATFGWSPALADIGIWSAGFSICDSSGACSYGSVEIQIVDDAGYLVSFEETGTDEFFKTNGLFAANCDNDLNPEIIATCNGDPSSISFRTMKLHGPDSISSMFTLMDGHPRRGGQIGFVDSDDLIDVVMAKFDNGDHVAVYKGVGDGSFTESYVSSTELPHTGRGAVLGEFTSDQFLDYVVVTLPAVVLYSGDSLGQFTELTQIPLGIDTGLTINTGDFDGDGHRDLAIGTVNGMRVYLGDGAGSFSLAGSYSQTYGSVDIEVTNDGSDFNNDNILDLCIATPSVAGARSELIVYLGDGNGTFYPNLVRDVKGQLHANAVGDFNLDGELDIALASGSEGYLAILFGDGTGSFTNEIRFHIPEGAPNAVVATDFDLDGDVDIAVATNTAVSGLFAGNLYLFTNLLNPPNLATAGLIVNGIDNADLQLTSASGQILNKVKNTSSSGGYYQRNMNSNSTIDDMLFINVVEQGAYTISVRPKPNLPAGETFCTEYTLDGSLYRLAFDIPMSSSGYDFVIFPSGNNEVLPVPGSFIYSNPPSFLWNGSGQFQFQLSDDIDFSSVVADLVVDGNSYTLPSELPVADTSMFFWRIKPVGQADYDAFYPVNVIVGGSGLCGDIDGSGATDVADLTFLVSYLFGGGPPPLDPAQADTDNSGSVDVADLTYLVQYLFNGGPPPICL